ncbi:hypothetical protein HZH68_002825 [Vespula germanica]|uniref:Uncharacterized protein n=1 Tax=Vespula germanica TaxID=30212 RepID=A0A834NMY0_VESGE|nr:hypothetical protein HZH68_002825 [Vespula germanica]
MHPEIEDEFSDDESIRALFPSFYEREREREREREKEREREREREVNAFSRLIARDKKLIRRLFKILPSLEGG